MIEIYRTAGVVCVGDGEKAKIIFKDNEHGKKAKEVWKLLNKPLERKR